MAVTQISRIQHRRGLEQDLPQLTSAELGWSIDTRRLYIGNGKLEEGAPTEGITRILTENDIADITSNVEFTGYTFVGNAAGYAAQTGPSALSPVVRTYQQKLDDFVNVKDFGATGDGVTDDAGAINRAIQQIYKSTVSPTEPRARRTIYFPGGTYLVSSSILIPPYARLVGDGVGSSIIKQNQGNSSVINLCDSSFQIGASIGLASSVVPQDIEISGLHFFNSNTSVTSPVCVIDSASNVRIHSSKFTSAAGAGFYPNLVSVLTSTATTKKITLDSCQMSGGGNGICLTGTGIESVRVIQTGFSDLSNVAMHLGDSVGFSSIGNHIESTGSYIISNGNNQNFAAGDFVEATNTLDAGVYFGKLQISTSQQYTITTSPTVLGTISNTASSIMYEIKNGSNVRFGTFSFTRNGSIIQYDDNYIETATGVDANLSANIDSILVSVGSGTAQFKLNFQRFV
jgi:hypothetical protein